MVKTIYGKDLAKEDFDKYLHKVKNDIFKLLPLREENAEWEKHLKTILIELNGLDRLINEAQLISILARLEGLFLLKEFHLYRKTIFEILSLFDGLR